jgi:hypothetical protein
MRLAGESMDHVLAGYPGVANRWNNELNNSGG